MFSVDSVPNYLAKSLSYQPRVVDQELTERLAATGPGRLHATVDASLFAVKGSITPIGLLMAVAGYELGIYGAPACAGCRGWWAGEGAGPCPVNRYFFRACTGIR